MSLRHKLTKTGVDFAFRRVTSISPKFLAAHGIRGLILDVDNTLAVHDDPVPAKGVAEWTENMKKHGVRLVIASNNHGERVKDFAELLGIDYLCDCGKPLRKGYTKALALMEFDVSETAAVGDQIFTDIWGANFSGVTSIYVKPIKPEGRKHRFIRFKRILEKPFLPKRFLDDRKALNL